MSEYLVIAVLAVIALAAVAYPLIVGYARYPDDDELDADIARYRAALDADTVCTRCRAANPEGSRFCIECGRALDPDQGGH